MELRHALSWSISRQSRYQQCRRRYYHDYYLSWRGWDRRAAPDRREAYQLKRLTRLPMLAGQIVHEEIEAFLKRKAGGQLGLSEMFVLAAGSRLVEAASQSAAARHTARWSSPKRGETRLAEHHYEELDDADFEVAVETARERVESCLRHFYAMPVLAIVRDCEQAQILAIESLSSFNVAGTPIFAVPDFALRRPDADGDDSEIWIFDWKTGRQSPRDVEQLALYALYARRTWKAAAKDVVCNAVYLSRPELVEHRFDEAALDQSRRSALDSIEQMRSLHFDADVSAGDAASFPMVADDAEGLKACSRCNYRQLCGR